MFGQEYDGYWKQQKKMMEDGENLIQQLRNQNLVEDRKIQDISDRIVHLAEVREGVKAKEKAQLEKRLEYEAVVADNRKQEKLTKIKLEEMRMAETGMENAEAETEEEWEKFLRDEEKKAPYQYVLNGLSETVRAKDYLANISEDNVRKMYLDCFTVEAMLAFDGLEGAAKQRFRKQMEHKQISSGAKQCIVREIDNEKALERLAHKYKDIIPDFSEIEKTIEQKDTQIRQKENEAEELERELNDDNSERNKKYRKRLEELKIIGSEQNKQYASLENQLHDIERKERRLEEKLEKKNKEKKELEEKIELQQQSLDEYDEIVKGLHEELNNLVLQTAEIEQRSSKSGKKKSDKAELSSLQEMISARKETIEEKLKQKKNCENLIQDYSNSMQDMEKEQSSLREALKAKGLEREQVRQEMHQVEEASTANNADIGKLEEQYRKEEEELKKQWEEQKQQLEELKKPFEMLKKAKSEMDGQFRVSEVNAKSAFKFEEDSRENRSPKEIDKREIYRDMASKVKAACRKFLSFEGDNKKEGHSNSDQFKGMMDQLDRIQNLGDEESLNMETYLEQLKTAAQAYKDAKNGQWFHFFPSNMRITRLAMADGLIAYCDQMKKQYELLGKMTEQVQPLPSATSNWKKFDKMMELNRNAQITSDNCREKIKLLSYKRMNTYADENREQGAEIDNEEYSFIDEPISLNDEQELDNSFDSISLNSMQL